jgi:hypothetical protein
MKAKLFRLRQVRYGLSKRIALVICLGCKEVPGSNLGGPTKHPVFGGLGNLNAIKKGFKPLAPLAGGLALPNGRSSLHCSEIVHGSIIT